MKKYISYGHQGKGTGASASFVLNGKIHLFDESEMAQSFAYAVAAELRGDVKTKRQNISLTETIKQVNAFCTGTDFAVEFHFNAANGKARGVEVCIADVAGERTRLIAEGLAKVVSETMGLTLRGKNGIKREKETSRKVLGFCRQTKPAAMICEICFIDNIDDVLAFSRHREALVDNVAAYINML